MTCPRCRRADCPSTIDHRKAGTCRAYRAQPSTLLYTCLVVALYASAVVIAPLLPAGVAKTLADLLTKDP